MRRLWFDFCFSIRLPNRPSVLDWRFVCGLGFPY
jgi:hypothetical protein